MVDVAPPESDKDYKSAVAKCMAGWSQSAARKVWSRLAALLPDSSCSTDEVDLPFIGRVEIPGQTVVVLDDGKTGTCIGGKLRHARFIAMYLPYAAGGLYSTADDLYRCSQVLMSGDVIGPAALQHMLRDHGQGYGYGWFVESADGRRVVRHGSGINGFLSNLDLHPDDDLTVIALANLQASGIGCLTPWWLCHPRRALVPQHIQ